MVGAIFKVQAASGAYFLLEEGSQKCFHENVPEHQVLTASYEVLSKDVFEPTPDPTKEGAKAAKVAECKISVKGPDEAVVKEHAVGKGTTQGKLAYVSRAHGDHTVCLICEQKQWFEKRKLKWSISFDILGGEEVAGGVKERDPFSGVDVATATQLKDTSAKVERLLERIEAIAAENEYEKKQEAEFWGQSENVNVRVTSFSVLQILLIGACTAFQIHHLSKFLKKTHMAGSCLPFRHF